jgi:uncharacterized protein YecE (DUF72 family)
MSNFLKIGTSGWMYKHWIGRFYPKDIKNKKMLKFYCRKFSTVEINNTFYQLPDPDSIKNWINETPKDFIFTVKANRYITHMKNLKEPQKITKKFFNIIKNFENNIGPVLFQLSSNWHVNIERLENFVPVLPDNYDYVFELRHPSWFCDEVYGLLRKNNIAFCFHDYDNKKTPLEITSQDLIYIRLHGSNANYKKLYSNNELNWWTKKIAKWTSEGKKIYVFFNNDAFGSAITNAIEIREKLKALNIN